MAILIYTCQQTALWHLLLYNESGSGNVWPFGFTCMFSKSEQHSVKVFVTKKKCDFCTSPMDWFMIRKHMPKFDCVTAYRSMLSDSLSDSPSTATRQFYAFLVVLALPFILCLGHCH